MKAWDVLQANKEKSEKDDPVMIEYLVQSKETSVLIQKALEKGDAEEFGRLMHQHWLHKKKRSSAISNDKINGWYDLGYASGALGGKLIGAGGGGFLMFYAKDRKTLREAMAKAGLPEVRF